MLSNPEFPSYSDAEHNLFLRFYSKLESDLLFKKLLRYVIRVDKRRCEACLIKLCRNALSW